MNDDETPERPEGWIAPTVPEPEPDDEPDEPDDEPEPEPAPPDDEAMEKLYKSVERKSANYGKAQTALLAETGLPWEGCPCCGVAGFVLPYNPTDPDEQMRRLAVLDYFDGARPDYKAASDRGECPACGGFGDVLSGSRKPGNDVVPCSRCNGTGYIVVIGNPAYTEANGTNTPPAPYIPDAPGEPIPAPDFWGRPPGHRDYGVLPSLVNA